MRYLPQGRVESEVLEFGKNAENTNVQTYATRPGLILAEGCRGPITTVVSSNVQIDRIDRIDGTPTGESRGSGSDNAGSGHQWYRERDVTE